MFVGGVGKSRQCLINDIIAPPPVSHSDYLLYRDQWVSTLTIVKLLLKAQNWFITLQYMGLEGSYESFIDVLHYGSLASDS